MREATMADVVEVDLAQPVAAKPPAVQQSHAVTAASATPADLLRIAVESGADLDKLERLMALQTQWEAKEAKRAFDAAFAAFKAESVTILKGRKVTDGPLKGKSYAELHDVVNAVTPALSKYGLSSSWKLTQDTKDWMEVTCYLRHVNGHEESVSMGGPPDAGGAKNAIQARASTKTYLERYTLKAITGLSEQMDDDDGNGKAPQGNPDEVFMKYESQLLEATTADDVRRVRALAGAAFEAVKDVKGWNQFKAMADKKKAEFEGGAK
ncbi:hypothetical protein FHX57_006809 [Paraburkholderia tropica]|uniref:ERF family protein n=1 Tax=Paraburkholderia tropica TaxID=92647 RepID=UPI001607A85D|nr:ERF family protein [Paraburkholderia tropica]MBB3004427.1 hypothetical protein [Paraburkholderia tropica]